MLILSAMVPTEVIVLMLILLIGMVMHGLQEKLLWEQMEMSL